MNASTTANPIYDRLTRDVRRPSEHAARWIGVGVGFLIGVTLIPLSRLPGEVIVLFVFGFEPLLVTASILVGSILAAYHMAQYARSDDFPLLRLTNVSAEKIAMGYSEGMLYRLWAARALAVWSPCGWVVSLILISIAASLTMCSGHPCIFDIFRIFNPIIPLGTMVAFGLAIPSFNLMVKSFIRIGVWFGLRRPHSAVALASLTALGALMVCSLSAAAGMATISIVSLACGIPVAIMMLLAVNSLDRYLREGTIRYITEHIRA